MPIVYDDLAKKAFGGTEYMMTELEKRLDKDLLDNFYISRCVGTITKLPKDKIKIFWAHQFPLPNFHNEPIWFTENLWSGFDKAVFVSNTQKNLFFYNYQIKDFNNNNCKVIHNAIEPLVPTKKCTSNINLIYISSPDRGLDILYDTFCLISNKYPNVTLNVFSSTSELIDSNLKEEKEKIFKNLYQKLKKHKKINYSERIPRAELLKVLSKSHIFVYPSTFWETFCISLIEAMSAKCVCIHSDYGALYETSGGLTEIYNYTVDRGEHISILYDNISKVIDNLQNSNNIYDLDFIKTYADKKYNWNLITGQWETYLKSLVNNRKIYYV